MSVTVTVDKGAAELADGVTMIVVVTTPPIGLGVPLELEALVEGVTMTVVVTTPPAIGEALDDALADVLLADGVITTVVVATPPAGGVLDTGA